MAAVAAKAAVAAEAAVAAKAAAAAKVAAAEDAGAKGVNEQKTLKPKIMNSLKLPFLVSVLLASSFLCAGSTAAAQTKTSAAAVSDSKQKQFNTPKEAADSLVQAAESFDTAALTEILGPDSNDVISSQDPVADKNRAVAFAAKAKEKSNLGTDPKNPNRAILTVGNDDFPSRFQS